MQSACKGLALDGNLVLDERDGVVLDRLLSQIHHADVDNGLLAGLQLCGNMYAGDGEVAGQHVVDADVIDIDVVDAVALVGDVKCGYEVGLHPSPRLVLVDGVC